MKRCSDDSQLINKRSAARNYPNYTVSVGETTVTEIGRDDLVGGRAFFENYIARRIPVKMKGFCPPLRLDGECTPHSIDISKFRPESLEATLLFNTPLQVEQKHGHGYGSGQKRVKLTLAQLMQKFRAGETDYYLTTQYLWDDPSLATENEDESYRECDDDDLQNNEIKQHDRSELNVSGSGEANGLFKDDRESHQGSIASLGPEATADDEGGFLDVSSIIDFDNLQDDYEDSDLDDGDDDDGSDNDKDEIVIELHQITQSELDMRILELLQPPLSGLINSSFPIVPELVQKLVPQQINLWLGCGGSKSPLFTITEETTPQSLGKYIPDIRILSTQKLPGTSSGLHHDHADNLYIVTSGRKRFTLFSPENVHNLHTVGTVRKLYDSGVIDYVPDENAPTWQSVRGDGAIIEQVLAWKLERNQKEHNLSDAEVKKLNAELESFAGKSSTQLPNPHLEPPSFSKIPPALLHIDEFEDEAVRRQLVAMASEHFPGFLEIPRLEVWLGPGETLYLPAGWFHEVSSFGGEKVNVHAALNYWFMPPTQTDAENCYEDDYWTEDWNRTQQCINAVREGRARLLLNR